MRIEILGSLDPFPLFLISIEKWTASKIVNQQGETYPRIIPKEICQQSARLCLSGQCIEGVNVLSDYLDVPTMGLVFSDKEVSKLSFWAQAFHDGRDTAFLRKGSSLHAIYHEYFHHLSRLAEQPYVKKTEEQAAEKFAKEIMRAGTSYRLYLAIGFLVWMLKVVLVSVPALLVAGLVDVLLLTRFPTFTGAEPIPTAIYVQLYFLFAILFESPINGLRLGDRSYLAVTSNRFRKSRITLLRQFLALSKDKYLS